MNCVLFQNVLMLNQETGLASRQQLNSNPNESPLHTLYMCLHVSPSLSDFLPEATIIGVCAPCLHSREPFTITEHHVWLMKTGRGAR